MGLQQVEANSLSDIIQLATNPPKYPRNPTEKTRESLTLYIARVPGSKDIILTTLKPQLKNVTAADVANSLYYLHLDTEDDARLLDDVERLKVERPPVVVEKPLPRKPLPESAKSSLDLQRGHFTSPASRIPINQYEETAPTVPPHRWPRDADQSPANTVSVPRRPIEPSAISTEPLVARKPLPHLPSVDSLSKVTSDTDRTEPCCSSSATSPTRPSATTMNSINSLHSRTQPAREFSITLIRRDPSSGGQWNIGKVVGQPLPDDGRGRGTKSRSEPRRCFYTMFIHITTPGYNWFREPQVSTHTMREGSPTKATDNAVTTQQGFNRQIWMERANFWDKPFGHQRQDSLEWPGLRGAADVRSSSDDSNERAIVSKGMDSADLYRSPANGYVFKSPWDGKCTFSTGGAGRNLRCKHTLPDRVLANSASSSQLSAAVSELRFNLPASAMFRGSATTAGLESVNGSISSKVNHIRNKLSSDKRPSLPPRPPPTSYAAMYPSDDEDARLDLSIGQEKAGGGNRGKRAKLGKLIIHDEGLKMIDLVVAANMSIWWSIWDYDQ